MQNKNFGIYAKVENSSYLTCIDRSTVRSVIAAALKKYVKSITLLPKLSALSPKSVIRNFH